MSFIESLQILGIEKYAERIFHSNSNGELFHLEQYIALAEDIGKLDCFATWFEHLVSLAEERLEYPEYIFQHIYEILEHQTINTLNA